MKKYTLEKIKKEKSNTEAENKKIDYQLNRAKDLLEGISLYKNKNG